MRIVSLCPSNTELICAIGLSHRLIAVDNYSDTPADIVRSLPRLGPDLNIDIDKLVSLSPDLVISSLSVPGMEKVVAGVESTGLTQLVLSSQTIDGIFADMIRIAEFVDDASAKRQAHHVTTELYRRIDIIRAATAGLSERPTLYWEWWPNPIFSPAHDNWLTELCQLAGAVNLFADVPGSSVQDDGTRVLDGQPDFVLTVWTGIPQHKVPIQKILQRPEIAGLEAVKKGQLYILSEGLYCRPSPRLIDGLEQLLQIIHPALATGLHLPAMTSSAPVRNMYGEWL